MRMHRAFSVVLSTSLFLSAIAGSSAVFAQIPGVIGDEEFRTPDAIERNEIYFGLVEGPNPNRMPGLSPDGRHLAVGMQRGDIMSGDRIVGIDIYDVAAVQAYINDPLADGLPMPRRVFEVQTQHPSLTITQLKWDELSGHLFFLADLPENENQSAVFEFSPETGVVEQVARLESSIDDFSISESTIAVRTNVPTSPEQRNRHGYVVRGETYFDVVIPGGLAEYRGKQYTLINRTNGSYTLLPPQVGIPTDSLRVSPSGKYLIGECAIGSTMPSEWAAYEYIQVLAGGHPRIAELKDKPVTHGPDIVEEDIQSGAFPLGRYCLVDTRTGEVRTLLDAPVGTFRAPVWHEEADFVTLVSFSPFRGDPSDEHRRPFGAEYSISVKISSGAIIDERPYSVDASLGESLRGPVTFELSANTDVPTEIIATDNLTGARRPISHLNPNFDGKVFGRSESLTWEDSTGQQFSGQLIYPVGYEPGRRYPLVIGTYGVPGGFIVEGPMNTGHSARALSSRGIMVLQQGCEFAVGRLLRAKDCIERARDELDRRGLIDPDRVGMIGFSRTGMFTQYVSVFADRPLAASLIIDSVQATPWNWTLTYGHPRPGGMTTDLPPTVGAVPVDQGLETWLERSPIFNFDRLQTPIRYQTNGLTGNYAFSDAWESFAKLKFMRRPVELFVLPGDRHSVLTPWGRFATQQGSVDWFDFWLNNHERTEPIPNTPETAESLTEQYARWRELRVQRDRIRAQPRPPVREWTSTSN